MRTITLRQLFLLTTAVGIVLAVLRRPILVMLGPGFWDDYGFLLIPVYDILWLLGLESACHNGFSSKNPPAFPGGLFLVIGAFVSGFAHIGIVAGTVWAVRKFRDLWKRCGQEAKR